MMDVHLPTTDGRHLVLSRHTQPSRDQMRLLQRPPPSLPEQPPPKVSTPGQAKLEAPAPAFV